MVFFLLPGPDCLAVRVKEQAGQIAAIGQPLPQVLVGDLLADEVERQSGRPDPASAVEQADRVYLGGELGPAGERGHDPGHAGRGNC